MASKWRATWAPTAAASRTRTTAHPNPNPSPNPSPSPNPNPYPTPYPTPTPNPSPTPNPNLNPNPNQDQNDGGSPLRGPKGAVGYYKATYGAGGEATAADPSVNHLVFGPGADGAKVSEAEP